MSKNFYQEYPDFIKRTDQDLKALDFFNYYSNTVNYGPNPVSNENPNYTLNKNYKNLAHAYDPQIKNNCIYRWDNDYLEWENKLNKSGKGLK